MKRTALIACCMLMFLAYTQVKAQVTIGSDIDPIKGALLELKDHVAGADSTTANSGGLLLPRVKLTNRTTLEPFIKTTDTEWNAANEAKTRTEHIGLMVYNLNKTAPFHQGIYIWRGRAWEAMEIASSYIYLPSFNLPWNGTSVNLFDIYKENFKPLTPGHYVSSRGVNQLVDLPGYDPEATDFDYVVTYYDPSALTISSISATGVMTYAKVGSDPVPPDDTYVNVVMIRK